MPRESDDLLSADPDVLETKTLLKRAAVKAVSRMSKKDS